MSDPTFCCKTGLEVAILLCSKGKLTLCHILLLIQHGAGWILYLRCMAGTMSTCIGLAGDAAVNDRCFAYLHSHWHKVGRVVLMECCKVPNDQDIPIDLLHHAFGLQGRH